MGDKNFSLSCTAREGIFLSATFFFLSFVTGAVFGDAEIAPTNIQPPLYYILAVNLGLCFLMLLSGLLLGIPSTALLLYNGYRFGAKFKSALIVLGLSETVMRLFPHLFSEIIAIILAASVGTTVLIDFVRKKGLNNKDLMFIALLAIVMTIISSYIEVYVTHKTVILSEVVK